MKIRRAVLFGIAFSLPVLPLLQAGVQGQTAGSPGPAPTDESPSPSARPLYYTHTFSFPGGTPRDLLAAAETMFQQVSFEKVDVSTNLNWSTGWQERLRAAEKELHATKVDWLSIADIPKEMMSGLVRVPRLRFDLTFMLLDGHISWTRRKASGSEEGMSLTLQVRENLNNIVRLYNRLGHERPELGQLLVDGNLDKPSAVMVVPEKSAIATQPEIKVKAFSLAGIPEKSLDLLQLDVRNAQGQAEEYSLRYGRGIGPGMMSIHSATHLLVATGSDAYVQMVESVVEAYRPKGPQMIDLMKSSNEK